MECEVHDRGSGFRNLGLISFQVRSLWKVMLVEEAALRDPLAAHLRSLGCLAMACVAFQPRVVCR